MNLIGSPSTLIANIISLAAVPLVTAEGAYIVHECYGYYRPQDFWGFLFPVVVAVIVRNRIFSFCFLALYIALSVQMYYEASIVHLDSRICGGRDDPIGYMAVFFIIAVACLAVYPLVALAKFIISLVASRE